MVIGNGNVLVGFDANYTVRDLYFPRVGDANQTMGNACRTGFFVDGKFAWLDDPGWQRDLQYAPDSLVTNVTWLASPAAAPFVGPPSGIRRPPTPSLSWIAIAQDKYAASARNLTPRASGGA